MLARRRLLGAASLAALLSACASRPRPDLRITGRAFSRTRIFVPPDAVFEAVLVDVTNENEPPVVLGRQWLDPAGSAPFDLSIPYFGSQIQRGGKYVVRAQVLFDGRRLFDTPGIHPVLTDPAFRQVDVILEPVALNMANAEAVLPLLQTYWRLTGIGDRPEHPLAAPAEGAAAPFLLLQPPRSAVPAEQGQGEFQGAGGCNRFLGYYALNGGALRFQVSNASIRLCLQGGEDEQAFLGALTRVMAYRQSGRELTLLGEERDDGKEQGQAQLVPLLHFKAAESGAPHWEPFDTPMQPQ